MAETKKGKERVWVRTYVTKSGTRVQQHYRTPACCPKKR